MDYGALADELEKYMTEAIRHPAPLSSLGLSRGEQGVLSFLAFEHDDMTPGELRARLNVVSGRVADTLNALERKALVSRAVDPEDNRRVIVSITERGRALIEAKREVFRREQVRLLEALGPVDAAEFVRLMRRVAELNRGRS